MTQTETTPRIFLTDYASYNNGSQFEFGHWVDLTDFSDADELNEYISNHFKEADKKSPLDSPREETMITDYEGLPKSMYSKSGMDFEKVYKYLSLDWDSKDEHEKISLWNEFCSDQGREDELYSFDEEFFETFFNEKPMEAARAASFGSMNWSDDYIYFNGYGNLESTNDPLSRIDEDELIDWLIERM